MLAGDALPACRGLLVGRKPFCMFFQTHQVGVMRDRSGFSAGAVESSVVLASIPARQGLICRAISARVLPDPAVAAAIGGSVR